MKPQFTEIPFMTGLSDWRGDWEPREQDLFINRERIKQRMPK